VAAGVDDPIDPQAAPAPRIEPNNAADEPVGPDVPLRTRQFLREGPLHCCATILYLLGFSVVLCLIGGVMWTSGYSLGCVKMYCYRQPSWLDFIWGEAAAVCSEFPAALTPFWEERIECGVIHRQTVVHVRWFYYLTMWFGYWPDFADVPLLYGLGRWFSMMGLGETVVRTTLVLPIWSIRYYILVGSCAALAFVWVFRSTIRWVMEWNKWLLAGDEVQTGSLTQQVDALVQSKRIDSELLYYLVGNVAFKPRDARSMANLVSQGRAWISSHRRNWGERESVAQVVEAATQAMTITTAEISAFHLWGSGVVYRGLVKARDVVGGLLKWDRQLPQ